MALSGEAAAGRAGDRAAVAAGIVPLTLASAQLLMTLDGSVMNASFATVAKDASTTVTGIQTAITCYALVTASLMITGGRLGQIVGRKRAFALGRVIYGCGSLTTTLAGNLAVLIAGWSVRQLPEVSRITRAALPRIPSGTENSFPRDSSQVMHPGRPRRPDPFPAAGRGVRRPAGSARRRPAGRGRRASGP